jgi:hypothetical protein
MKLRLSSAHPFQKVLLDALLVSCHDLHFGLLLSDQLKELCNLDDSCVRHDVADRVVMGCKWLANKPAVTFQVRQQGDCGRGNYFYVFGTTLANKQTETLTQSILYIYMCVNKILVLFIKS